MSSLKPPLSTATYRHPKRKQYHHPAIVLPRNPCPSRPAYPPSSCLAKPSILIPFMPVVNLASYTLSVAFVLFARFDQKFRAMSRTAEMTLEIFPTAVWLKSTTGVGTSVRSQRLLIKVSYGLFSIQGQNKTSCGNTRIDSRIPGVFFHVCSDYSNRHM